MKLIAQKIGMTSIFDANGVFIPVTLLKVFSSQVCGVKKQESDGYNAVVMGAKIKKRANKPQEKAAAKINDEALTDFYEERNGNGKIGEKNNIETLENVKKVNITGVSKGKGFSGTIKRHRFNTGPKTHGSKNYRKPGSIGSTYPQRVVKGKKMAGRMGGGTVTVKNVEVLSLDKKNSILAVKGSVPGAAKSFLYLKF